MANPSTSALTKQIINRVTALYLYERPDCSIDDLVIAAATPAIHTQFKEIDPKQMYLVMLRMKQFVSRHSRFKNFTKEAAAEGLRKEWLPSLEEDDKVALLENLMFIDHVDEDGKVVTDPKYYDSFVDVGKKYGDTTKYGNQPYTLVNKPSSEEKVTSLEPDKNLEEKLKDYIAWYKRWLKKKYMYEHEHYKWVAIAQFKHVFEDVSQMKKEGFATNLQKSLSKSDNLLAAPHYYARQVLIKAAQIASDDVRSALLMLFDETLPLPQRADDFISQMKDIVNANKSENGFGAKDTSQQDLHAVSVYLSFMYPNIHYIFKSSIWYNFCDITGLDYPSLSVYTHRLVGYENLCSHIREVLLADTDLVEWHDKIFDGSSEERPKDQSDYLLLTQDFIYAIGAHFVDFEKNPAYFIEGQDRDLFPIEEK